MRSLDFLERLERATSPGEVIGLVAEAAHGFGMTAFALGEPPRDGAFGSFWYSTWPDSWLEAYASEGFSAVDPVPRAAAQLLAPALWSAIFAGGTGASIDAAARRVVDAGASAGFRNGLIVPIHGPGGYLAIASFAGPETALSRSEMAELHMIAFYAHDRLRALHGWAFRINASLTKRESEALCWVLAGCSDAEIAQRMGITERTARFHVDNARVKLGARTRAQAAAAAVRLGLIHP